MAWRRGTRSAATGARTGDSEDEVAAGAEGPASRPLPRGSRDLRAGVHSGTEPCARPAPRATGPPAFAPPPAGPQTRPRPRPRPQHAPACPVPAPPRLPAPPTAPLGSSPLPRATPGLRSPFRLPALLRLKFPGPVRSEGPTPAGRTPRGHAPHPGQRLLFADPGPQTPSSGQPSARRSLGQDPLQTRLWFGIHFPRGEHQALQGPWGGPIPSEGF